MSHVQIYLHILYTVLLIGCGGYLSYRFAKPVQKDAAQVGAAVSKSFSDLHK